MCNFIEYNCLKMTVALLKSVFEHIHARISFMCERKGFESGKETAVPARVESTAGEDLVPL